jgi:hypothetical protein
MPYPENRAANAQERAARARWPHAALTASLATLTLAGCARFDTPRTPADAYRQRLAALADYCKRRPSLGPGDRSCDPLAIQPEDWLATPEGRFAHAIQIPNPVPADSGYRPGMTQVEYFEHLCKTEAGEFIFRTVDNVEGIRLLRWREPAGDYVFQDLYAMEDPYGHLEEEAEEPGFELVGPTKYAYLETPLRKTTRDTGVKQYRSPTLYAAPVPGQTLERYFGYDTRDRKTLQLEYDNAWRSRYAITWRGIKRPNDRELGIAGGELIVLDLETNEVLGVRRGYALFRGSWETAPVCPRYGYYGGRDKFVYFSFWFTGKLARPPNWQAYADKLEQYRKK